MDTEFGSATDNFAVTGKVCDTAKAEVLSAWDLLLDRPVSLKVDKEDTGDGERFLKESCLLGGLDHPNIATVHSLLLTGNHRVMVMERLDGGTIADRLRLRGALPIPESIDVMTQLLAAMHYLHSNNILVRNYTPEMIGQTSRGTVKLFELSFDASPFYLSPEQVVGREVDHRSEIFSAGILHYELLTGWKPFFSDERDPSRVGFAVACQICMMDPPPPDVLRPEIPRTLCEVVMKALEKDPARRFQSAYEYRQACRIIWGELNGMNRSGMIP